MGTSNGRRIGLALLGVVAAAVAGCGSSSTKTKASTAATSASSSTPNSNSSQLPKATPIASPAFYNFALQVATSSAPQLNASQAASAAQCFQKGFLAAGFKTQEDLERDSNGAKARSVTETCILKAEGQ